MWNRLQTKTKRPFVPPEAIQPRCALFCDLGLALLNITTIGLYAVALYQLLVYSDKGPLGLLGRALFCLLLVGSGHVPVLWYLWQWRQAAQRYATTGVDALFQGDWGDLMPTILSTFFWIYVVFPLLGAVGLPFLGMLSWKGAFGLLLWALAYVAHHFYLSDLVQRRYDLTGVGLEEETD